MASFMDLGRPITLLAVGLLKINAAQQHSQLLRCGLATHFAGLRKPYCISALFQPLRLHREPVA